MRAMRLPGLVCSAYALAFACPLALTSCDVHDPPPAPSAMAPSASPAPQDSAEAALESLGDMTHVATLPSHKIACSGGPDRVAFDYIAYDPKNARIWLPTAEMGTADVIDTHTETVTPVKGFATKEKSPRHWIGPTSVTMGDGFAYVGNRADSKVCAVDSHELTMADCVALPVAPDGLSYVAKTKEIWATIPADKSIAILDGKIPKSPTTKTTIKLPGKPEGYAADDARGLFYTNLEDTNKTLVIDTVKRTIVATWDDDCGADGPRGLAFDAKRRVLFVACTDHVVSRDAAHDGAVLGSAKAGGGVDAIDFAPLTRTLMVPSGKIAKILLFKVDDKGALALSATADTADGARVVVADERGVAYVADPLHGRVIVVPPP